MPIQVFNDFLDNLKKLRPLKLCSIILLIEIIQSLIFVQLFPSVKGYQFANDFEKFLLLLILGPLAETYLFQQLIIRTLFNYFKISLPVSMLVSAIFFGLTHPYGLLYIAKTFISGLLFGTIYLALFDNINKAFLWVALTHASYNLFTICYNYSM
jgi:hypothetical protein